MKHALGRLQSLFFCLLASAALDSHSRQQPRPVLNRARKGDVVGHRRIALSLFDRLFSACDNASLQPIRRQFARKIGHGGVRAKLIQAQSVKGLAGGVAKRTADADGLFDRQIKFRAAAERRKLSAQGNQQGVFIQRVAVGQLVLDNGLLQMLFHFFS